MPHEHITFHRDALYGEVWAEPVRTVATRYGISDVALAKICRKLGVPVPGVGYWAKKGAGHRLKQTPLPSLADGATGDVTINRRRPEVLRIVDLPAAESIAMPEVLGDLHALVAITQKRLVGRRPGSDGLAHCTTQRCLDICVSTTSLNRALRLLDALIKACEQRGLGVEVSQSLPPAPRRGYEHVKQGQPPYVTHVVVEGQSIQLRLVEHCRVERDAPPTPPKHLKPGWDLDRWVHDHRPPERYIPTGMLRLAATAGDISGTWRDYRRKKLESRLGEVIAQLYGIAAEAKRVREDAEQREREWAEERLRREEAERRAYEQRRNEEQIRGQLESWRLARDLRSYADDARRIVAEAQCTVTPGGPLERLIEFAETYAERVDPFTGLRREVEQHRLDREAADKGDAVERARESLARSGALETAVRNRRYAAEIRNHVHALRSVPKEFGCWITGDCPLDRALVWALEFADRIDPLVPVWKDAKEMAKRKAHGSPAIDTP